jgi:alkylation response protein AidB-like acyl-CoA dehydrogenase
MTLTLAHPAAASVARRAASRAVSSSPYDASELKTHGRFPAPADPHAVAASIAAELAATAVARDAAGGHPAKERERLRASGLLTLSVPDEYGGAGGRWFDVYRVVRKLAEADSAVAHLFGFHHLQIAGVLLYGSPEQRRLLLQSTVDRGLFWGNALNPLDRRTVAVEEDEGYDINGIKSFCSGSVGSDLLTLSAWHPATQTNLIAAIPTRRFGVSVEADWDAFGQRQTDSGNVTFDHVRLDARDILVAPGTAQTAFQTLRTCVAQLSMTNLYLGIARGGLDAAIAYTTESAHPWFASGVERSADDPFVQRRYGELHLLVKPAALLADAAAEALDDAFALGHALTAEERAEVAIAVAEAKVLAHRAALAVGSEMFENTGARSTSARFGFDRFWRNARTHTLHDPVDYKIRDIGRYAIEGRAPDPSPYS